MSVCIDLIILVKMKYTEKRLNTMRKDKLFALCLRHFGNDTAAAYSKEELIADLLTVEK